MDLNTKLEEKNAQQQTGLVKGDRPKTIMDIFKGEDFKKAIANAAPKHFKPERMVQLALQMAKDVNLAKCTPMTVLAGVMMGTSLGLEINTPLGQAYLIAYKNSKLIEGKWVKVPEAQFQIGYQGILNLCYRTNEYKMIYAHEVDKSDKFSFRYGLNKDMNHIPSDNPSGDITHYYAAYHTKNGGFDFVVMSMEAVKKHRDKFSKAESDKSPWKTNFDEMAKKTLLKKVLKYAPKSIELSQALAQDESIKEYQDDSNVLDSANLMDFSEFQEVESTEPENKETITPGETTSQEQKKNDVIIAPDNFKAEYESKAKEVFVEAGNKAIEILEEKETEADTIFDQIKEDALEVIEEEQPQEEQYEEPIKLRLEPKQLQQIHIIMGEINKHYEFIGKPKVEDAEYRGYMIEEYGVESSKDLSPDQASSFIIKLRKRAMQVETCDEAKAKRAAIYKAEQDAKKNPGKTTPTDTKTNGTRDDLPTIDEVFPGSKAEEKPRKDFVGDARKEMLRLTEEAEAKKKAEAEKPKQTKQVDLFSTDMPDFMK